MLSTRTAHSDDLASQLGAYAAEFDVWLAAHEDVLKEVTRPIPKYADRVAAVCQLMAALYDGGWARFGWPIEVGVSAATCCIKPPCGTRWPAAA